jgi:diguanylate cyclase (GGDEF)-like protein
MLAAIILIAVGSGGTVLFLRKTLRSGKEDSTTRTLRAGQIDQFITRRLREVSNANSSFAVLLVDVDEFKRVNDEYNHEIGNHTLSELVEVIRPRSRGEEIFRYGGDEFLVVTNTGVDDRGCWGYANRIVREVAAYQFLGQVNSPERIRLTVSVGAFVSNGTETVSEIRNTIVRALKKAKEAGKNSAYLFRVPDRGSVNPSPSGDGWKEA